MTKDSVSEMTITDEMVEKAREVYWDQWESGGLRAAIEAIAPDLIAIGMERAAEIADARSKMVIFEDPRGFCRATSKEIATAIRLAAASQLREKKGE